MEDLKRCHKQSTLLEKRIAESKLRWHTFISSQTGYRSMIKCEGKGLPPPVMTPEKRRKMQMYRKQAYIAEVRLKSRSREKDFLQKIQGALDEVREFHVDTSDSSDLDILEERVPVDYSVTSSSKLTDELPSMTSPIPVRKSKEAWKEPPSIVIVPQSPRKYPKAKSTTDLTKIGKADHDKREKPVNLAPKIHRRRYNSDGKSEPHDTDRTRPHPPSSQLSKRSRSSGNLLEVPFEQYRQEVEELTMGLSRPRQRYTAERARALRTPSPQPTQDKLAPPNRPVSTPPDVSSAPPDLFTTQRKQQRSDDIRIHSDNKSTQHTVSRRALKLLLNNLDPSHDQPTHQWLAARVSDQEKNLQEDISLDDWFQNAPDSVKQKLASLLPKVSSDVTEQADDRKGFSKSVDVHISPVQTCNSSDDTLRSTSPIPDEDRSLPSQSFTEFISDPTAGDNLPLVVIEKSPNTSRKTSPSVQLSESYTVFSQEPSVASIETVVEVDVCHSKRRPEEPVVPRLLLSPDSPSLDSAAVDGDSNTESPSNCLLRTAVGERKRSLSMQSYTLEEPSEALINFTLNEQHEFSVLSTPGNMSSTANAVPSANPTSGTATHRIYKSPSDIRPREVSAVKYAPVKANGEGSAMKFKSRIPTSKTKNSLLSKCELDSPMLSAHKDSPVTEVGLDSHVSSQCTTRPDVAKHRQLVKLMSQVVVTEHRALTPTPSARVLTPTPPERPKSENGTWWRRSSSRSRTRDKEADTGNKVNVDEVQRYPNRRLKYAADSVNEKEIPSSTAKFESDSSHPKAESVGRRGRSASLGVPATEETHQTVDTPLESDESPLKNYDGRDDRLARARKQLALLKSKFALRSKSVDVVSQRDAAGVAGVSQRAGSAPSSAPAPSTSAQMRSPGNQRMKSPEKATSLLLMNEISLQTRHLETIADDDQGKENITESRSHSRTSNKSFIDKEETPITTAYSSANDTQNEYSMLGNILSASHRTNRPSPDSHLDLGTVEKGLGEGDPQISAGRAQLHALIKGHLCRKLFACSKVKSIIKTIQDCRSLLPSILSVNSNSALHDSNFQQRIKLQMVAAREDLHHVFFNLTTHQKMALLKQTEMVLARHRLRQTNRSKRSRGPQEHNQQGIEVKARVRSTNVTTTSALRHYTTHRGNDAMNMLAV